MQISEAVTDSQGHFTIAAWGPKLMSPDHAIDDSNPRLEVFMNGYEFETLYNKTKHTTYDLTPDWNERVVMLHRFRWTLEQRAKSAAVFFQVLHSGGFEDDPSDWHNYPKTTAAICKETRELRAQGLSPNYGLPPWIPRRGDLSRESRRVDPAVIRECVFE